MHNMPAREPSQRFNAFKQRFMTNWTMSLQRLWYANMIRVDRNTCVASHTVSIVNSKSFTSPTYITERTVIYRFLWIIVIEITNTAMITCKRLSFKQTLIVFTRICCWLQCQAVHTHNFFNGISIKWWILDTTNF